MSGHTPGPWTLETVQTSVGWCHKVGPFPWKNGKENHACVYDDYASGHNGTPELIANARLIAAAPELLEALESVKQCGFDDEDASGWGVVYITREDWDAVVFAIAKAKGEV